MLSWFKRLGTSNLDSAAVASAAPTTREDKLERLVERLEMNTRVPQSGQGASKSPDDRDILELSPEIQVERLADRLVASATASVKRCPLSSSSLRVIAVASQKGGCGKTTIAAHLAVRASMLGEGPAVLVDTDPQGSLTEWWRERNDPSLALISTSLDDLPAQLEELRTKTAVAIIDTPPALTASIEQAIALADLVLIPARPSPHDLRAIGGTLELVHRARKPFLFVVNGAAPRASITAECVAALSEHGRVAPGILHQRTDFAASMIDGRTVMEAAPASRSVREVADLWKAVSAPVNARAAA